MKLCSTLNSYLFRQSSAYLGGCLVIGTGIYLLADMFDRLDDFIEAGLGASVILTYYAAKLPLIVSQILPGAYLLAAVLVLSIMVRSRELLALQSGGISIERMIAFFIAFGLLWSGIQFGFSQGLGVSGLQQTSRIWKEQVRKHAMENRMLEGIWFRDGNYMVSLEKTWPAKGRVEGITLFEIPQETSDGFNLTGVIQAEYAEATPGEWTLHKVRILNPSTFTMQEAAQLALPLKQDIRHFLAADPKGDPGKLPMWQLGEIIERLEASGSNVEGLKTAYHMKLAYAFSILVMSLLALAVITFSENIFVNIILSLVLTFAYYGVFIVGVSSGQKGLLPPMPAAWAGNILFGGLALARLLWDTRPRKVKAV